MRVMRRIAVIEFDEEIGYLERERQIGRDGVYEHEGLTRVLEDSLKESRRNYGYFGNLKVIMLNNQEAREDAP